VLLEGGGRRGQVTRIDRVVGLLDEWRERLLRRGVRLLLLVRVRLGHVESLALGQLDHLVQQALDLLQRQERLHDRLQLALDQEQECRQLLDAEGCCHPRLGIGIQYRQTHHTALGLDRGTQIRKEGVHLRYPRTHHGQQGQLGGRLLDHLFQIGLGERDLEASLLSSSGTAGGAGVLQGGQVDDTVRIGHGYSFGSERT
jgi:hypothetical protein